MQNFTHHQSVFVPNYPPPPLLHQFQSGPSDPSAAPSRLQLFKERLENYAKQKCAAAIVTKAANRKRCDVKLSDVKQDLRDGFKTIETLKHKRDQLIANLDVSNDADWHAHIDEIEKLKETLVAHSTKYNCPNHQKGVQDAITWRREKRFRIKKRKEATKQWKMSMATEKMRKNNEIDEWLRSNNESILDERRRIDAAKRAEQVLGGVTKKKTEARRYIELLNSLVELRRVRVVQSGKHDNGQQAFAAKIGQLKDVWLDAIQNYDREERELNKLIKSDEAIVDDWYETLFGIPRASDHQNPIHKADHSFNELLRIR